MYSNFKRELELDPVNADPGPRFTVTQIVICQTISMTARCRRPEAYRYAVLLIELHHYHHDTGEQEAETLLQDKQMPHENIISLHLSI